MPICDFGTSTVTSTSSNSTDYIYSAWISQYNSDRTATTTAATNDIWVNHWARSNVGTSTVSELYSGDTSITWRTWVDTTPTGRIIRPTMSTQEFRTQYQATWTEWVDVEVKETKRRQERDRHGNVNVAARAAQRQQQLDRQREVALQAERKRIKRGSLERSMLLLRDACNDDQIQQLEEEGSLIVVGKSGTRYKVTDRGTVANVHVLDAKNKVSHRLCAHPLRVPQGDVMLAQKLMLEHDEEGFVKLANRHLAYGH